MSFSQQDIQTFQEMFTASEGRMLGSMKESEQRLRDEIKSAIRLSEKRLRTEWKKAIKEANENQTQLLTDMIGSLADNLDDAYAPKKTEERVDKIAEHLRATP